MKIRYRNNELNYALAIRDDKTLIVLEWLLEFRFSTYEILSTRIDSNAVNSSRFFYMLIVRELIKVVQSSYAIGRKLVMLAPNGVGFLQSKGRSTDKAIISQSRVGKYSNLMHDIAIQHVVLNAIESRRNEEVSYTDVLWDRNITNLEHDVRPDALLKTNKDQLVCFEIEHYRKDKKKIFYKYRLHAENIIKGRYQGIIYFFLDKADEKYYEKLCNMDSWPFVVKEKTGRGRLIVKKNDFNPGEVSEYLTECFSFIHSGLMDISIRK